MIEFALSAVLILVTAGVIVRRFPEDAGVRFWAFVAAVSLQLTGLHQVTSVFHALTPAGFLIAQAGVLAAVVAGARVMDRRIGRRRFPRPVMALVRWAGWRSPVCIVLAAGVAAAMGLSLAEVMLRPVTGFDERMYNCSRVLYWIQHGHIWPWVTHNDAQVNFPIGSEVFFSWPILFTRTEWVGRLVHWLGYPAAVAGVYVLTRTLRASRPFSLAASLVFAMTPVILYTAGVNQKQDIWTAVMLLGATDWIVRCWVGQRAAHACGREFSAAMLGLFVVLAVNVKVTSLAVAPMVVLALVVPCWRRWKEVARNVQGATIGGAAALVVSGLGLMLVQNASRYGNPLGPNVAAKSVSPEWTVRQVYTHAVRTPMQLIELPTHPSESFRKRWIEAGDELVYQLDAHRALPGERKGAWPGWFSFEAGRPHDPRASRFSLGGIAWLVGMVWAGMALLKRAAFGRRKLAAPFIALIVSTLQLAGLVFMVMWVGGSERYWVAPYAVGLCGFCACVNGWARWRWIAGVLLLLVALTVYPSFESIAIRLRDLHRQPVPVSRADEPFTEIVTKLPPGSTILFFGNRNARDYPLFLPRKGYPNRVVPWGREKFDSERLEQMVREHRITHAVFEYEDRLGFHWYPGVRVAWMVEWFHTRPYFREIPLATSRQRLFERTDLPP